MSPRRAAARALPLLGALVWLGCMDFGLWTDPPPLPPPQIPAPQPFKGKEAPALVPTETPELLQAPSLSKGLYFYEPDGLWYRRWRGRWYQAFTWDGHWFPPRRVPDAVRATVASEPAPKEEAKPAPAP